MAEAAELDGLWCNVSPVQLEAGIREKTCAPGTVGITFQENGKDFRQAGVELLCGEEIDPVFLPFHLLQIEGALYTSSFNVGWLKGGAAEFTLGSEDFTATDFILRPNADGTLFYDEATRDLEGWIINRNRGTFRKMPVGSRSCAAATRSSGAF